ncbi:hypothetical protein KEM48_009762 [Puccinia striiformis f. sp. tritici PST-130]|nr:hypothetical protein KEM48_009762 [Puccinia striiformis f. sp. tritici PST-130]
MFLQTRALIVYGALLTLVIGMPATYTGARLARRMESAMNVGKDTKGSEIFTHADLKDALAKPEESGLTLMEFNERAGREMGVDSRHINRFVNEYLSGFMDKVFKSEKFELQSLYKDHLEWVKSDKYNDVQVSALSQKMDKNPEKYVKGEITLHDYLSKVDDKIFTRDEANDFVDWRLAQKWRSQYKDTEKLDLLDLLEDYMVWAGKDSRLKDNIYVKNGTKLSSMAIPRRMKLSNN